jgi:hypothetical protein
LSRGPRALLSHAALRLEFGDLHLLAMHTLVAELEREKYAVSRAARRLSAATAGQVGFGTTGGRRLRLLEEARHRAGKERLVRIVADADQAGSELRGVTFRCAARAARNRLRPLRRS